MRERRCVARSARLGSPDRPGVASAFHRFCTGPARDAAAVYILGDLFDWWVGDDQLDVPWLDESLAGYSTILYYEDTYGKAVADQVLKQVFEEPYQNLVRENRDQKVDQPVSAFTPGDYSTVVYRKGPLFFKALREAIGDAKFDAFLKAYLRQNRYGVATPERMLAAAESVADRATVRSLFDKWIESTTTP